MASYGQSLRRGLPRRPGGEPWPPAGAAPAGLIAAPVSEPADIESAVDPVAVAETVAAPTAAAESVAAPAAESAAVAAPATAAAAGVPAARAGSIRRGLPRIPGGEPWPPASIAPPAAAAAAAQPVAAQPVAAQPVAAASAPAAGAAVAQPAAALPVAAASAPVAGAAVAPAPASAPSSPAAPAAGGRALRRGLPRTPGGEPWPPAGMAPTAQEIVVETVSPAGETTAAVAVAAPSIDVSTPLPFTRTVWQGAAGRRFEAERRAGKKIVAPEPKRYGPFTRLQWAGIVVVGGGGLLFAALMAVFAVRWLLSLEPLQEWLALYPGEYHLPVGAPVGFPAWLAWQHFFNVFLMILIIRSGLQVRTEKRPTAFWSPRTDSKRKISLNLWFHQSLDILWVVNGVIFVVLLFVSGQWMRVVPTSWEVFPNALSAALQYVSLDWPTENGWVNYNSLQQLAYFTTIFIAAPLAIVTGVRMSGIWPKNAKTLNRIYPVEWARAVHFPVMLYFVLFIFVHVVLVFATGALRNLNHMYAAQGSIDPDEYMMNWTGFWIFSASILVIAIAWAAARPLVLAPIARLFGTVSGR